MASTKTLGTVENELNEKKEVTVSSALLILGGAAAGAWVGASLGGAQGALVGSLVGAFIGGFTAGYIKNVKVIWHPNGKVEVKFETRF
ncbi:TPA: glycine zipper domain-containing protein [Vibrio parahaemolyticus]